MINLDLEFIVEDEVLEMKEFRIANILIFKIIILKQFQNKILDLKKKNWKKVSIFFELKTYFFENTKNVYLNNYLYLYIYKVR